MAISQQHCPSFTPTSIDLYTIARSMRKSTVGYSYYADDDDFCKGDFTLVSWDKRRFKVSSALLLAARYVNVLHAVDAHTQHRLCCRQ